MDKKFDVVAVGMINFDINVKTFRPDGMNRKVQEVDQISLAFGGDAQNCSATMARLGLKTAICGAVGKDIASELCLSYERQAGVDTSMVCRKDVQTGTAIQLFQTAEAHVVDCAGANTGFELADVPDELYGSSRIVSLHSFFGCGKIGADFLKKARDAGAVIVADTTSLLPGDSLADIQDALQHLDYFVPSFAEASELTGETDPEKIADRFMALGARNIAIKMGDQGCFIKAHDVCAMVPGFRVDELVDTTGCGDNFVAGFIAGLVKELPIVECAKLGNAAGAINAMYLGSNGGVRSYEQLLEFIRKNEE